MSKATFHAIPGVRTMEDPPSAKARAQVTIGFGGRSRLISGPSRGAQGPWTPDILPPRCPCSHLVGRTLANISPAVLLTWPSWSGLCRAERSCWHLEQMETLLKIPPSLQPTVRPVTEGVWVWVGAAKSEAHSHLYRDRCGHSLLGDVTWGPQPC